MIIGIDGNEANIEKKVGIGEYAYELLVQFSKTASKRRDLIFRIYLKENPRNDLPPFSENWQYKVVGPKKLWTRIGLPFALFISGEKPDVFFSPTHYGPRFSPVKTAMSIMDLSFIHFPELFTKHDLFQLKNWTKVSAKNTKKIFTISNFSRDDIIKTYKANPDKVVVTYLGIKSEFSKKVKYTNMEELKKKFGIKGNYILFVGTLQPRKNIVRLIEAFSKVSDKNLQLVIVGKKGWQYDEILSAPDKFNVSDRTKFLDFVTNEDLPSLYRNALCFVLPSLYEGFGLPVLEAMQYGCPVLASNVSSLPEAGGDAAVYFNPNDANDIAKTIEKVIKDEKLRQEMVKKGYNQIKKFSWEKTAQKTLKVLEDLVNER